MVSSISFNRAMNRPAINNNGGSSGGITRASSFQNKFNPKGFSSSLSGPGSDNDSLHSSSSSLEYSIQGGGGEGGGGGVHPGKPGSLSYSTSPQMEQRPGQQRGVGLGMGKKFSSHGSVFHSELEGPMGLGAPEPRGVSHGSMPSLDLQMGEGGGGVMGLRGAGGGGVRYGNANVGLNGGSQRHYNTSPFGKEGCYSPNQNHNSYQAQPKPKETQRLNKFPWIWTVWWG
uniref:putative glycine-rich cell wall structural protein 1 n=1 Tax=Oncorhynchus gorbuscha TaxID=8017 RepID=UPI001EAED313|nr:putative glycine-rich cell wall structural protein 1 [Oncorhynchus gorbuscha]